MTASHLPKNFQHAGRPNRRRIALFDGPTTRQTKFFPQVNPVDQSGKLAYPFLFGFGKKPIHSIIDHLPVYADR